MITAPGGPAQSEDFSRSHRAESCNHRHQTITEWQGIEQQTSLCFRQHRFFGLFRFRVDQLARGIFTDQLGLNSLFENRLKHGAAVVHYAERKAALCKVIKKHLTLKLIEVGQSYFAKGLQHVMLKSVKIGFPRRRCPLWLPHRQEPLTGKPFERPAVCGRLALGSALNFISEFVLSFPLARLCFIAQIDSAMATLLLP